MNVSLRWLVPLAICLSLAGVLLGTASSAGAQAAVRIPVDDLWFCDSSNQNGVCTTEISVGDTVIWDFEGATLPHTTANCGASCDSADGSLWNSGTINDGSTFQFTFSEAGTFLYRCNIHPAQMRGQIIVTAAAQEPTPPMEVDDLPADVGAPEVVAAPSAGTGPKSSSAISAWYVAGLAMSGLLLGSAGLALVVGRRRQS